MTKYKISHLLLIITSVVFAGVGLLWIFDQFIPNPYPNVTYYVLLSMYIIMLASTGIIFKTKQLIPIHTYIGFHSIKTKHIYFAILIAFFIYGLDYLYQTRVLNIDITIEAKNWYKNQTNLIAAFFSTVIFAPIIEEMLFRGIILQTFNQYLNKACSAIVLSVVFALIHFDVLQIPTLIIASLIYVWLTYNFKSIVPAIIAHIMNNCLTFMYYISINGI